jgi:hypothetical protein
MAITQRPPLRLLFWIMHNCVAISLMYSVNHSITQLLFNNIIAISRLILLTHLSALNGTQNRIMNSWLWVESISPCLVIKILIMEKFLWFVFLEFENKCSKQKSDDHEFMMFLTKKSIMLVSNFVKKLEKILHHDLRKITISIVQTIDCWKLLWHRLFFFLFICKKMIRFRSMCLVATIDNL